MSDLKKDELQYLEKSSRQAAFITAIGFAILLTTIGYSGWKLKNLDTQVASKTNQINRLSETTDILSTNLETLSAQIVEKGVVIKDKEQNIRDLSSRLIDLEKQEVALAKQIDALRTQKDGLIEEFQKFGQNNSLIAAKIPLEAVITPKSKGIFAGMEQEVHMFNYSLWLEVPKDREQELRRVSYYFNHPSYTQPTMHSSNHDDGFAVHYYGWGCLDNVIITLSLADRSERKVDFDMCAAVNK